MDVSSPVRGLAKSRLWPILGLLTATAQTYAAHVLDVQVTRQGASFLIGVHIAIAASPPEVFRALRDYAAMPRYNPDLRTVRVEPTSEPNRVRLFTTLHTCILLFCRTIQQEQIMTATIKPLGGLLRSELVSKGGAFNGRSLWTVRPCRADGTSASVDMRAELVPTFWVPPVIGPWLIRRKLHEEAQLSSAGLEQVAQDGHRSIPKSGRP